MLLCLCFTNSPRQDAHEVFLLVLLSFFILHNLSRILAGRYLYPMAWAWTKSIQASHGDRIGQCYSFLALCPEPE